MAEAHPIKFHPASNIFPLLEGADFAELVEDILAHGLREKIWMHPNGTILDGRNRYRACIKAGVEPQFREWRGRSPINFVVSMNLKRRHLNSSQRAVLALALLPLLEKEAAERQHASRAKPGQKVGSKASEKIHSPEKGRSDQKAADIVKANQHYVSDAKKLQSAAPDLFSRVQSGDITIPQAKQEIKRRQKVAVAEQIRSEPPTKPEGPFRVIVIDPPWKYETRAEDQTHRARNPYPDVTLEEIKSLPVSDLAHEDCIVWLWTTNAFMREAFTCLDAWGFECKTILTWVKDRMGLGDWLRGQTEHCLMSVRGRPVVTLTNQTTALIAPLREHSRKPEAFYALAESLCPGSKLEMFAREKRAGWTAWGAEL